MLQTLGCLALALSGACRAAPPRVDGAVELASSYVFRGSPRVAGEVLTTRLTVGPEQAVGTNWSFSLHGVNDLTDDADGVLDGSDGGLFAQLDGTLELAHSLPGFELAASVTGFTFRGDALRDTTEVALTARSEVLGLDPTLLVFYDVDEVEGGGLRASLLRRFELEPERVQLRVLGALSVLSDDQGQALFGADEAGVGAFEGELRLSGLFGAGRSLFAGVRVARVVGSDYRSALADAGRPAEEVSAFCGFGFGY